MPKGYGHGKEIYPVESRKNTLVESKQRKGGNPPRTPYGQAKKGKKRAQ
jgi:hypothetical protein